MKFFSCQIVLQDMSNILNLIQCVVDSAEEKNSSFAILGLCIGLCELQMCCLCVGISYFLVANCPILLFLFHLLLTFNCMWSGGISKRNPVRPAGKWAQGLTCQTAKTPACHVQFLSLKTN